MTDLLTYTENSSQGIVYISNAWQSAPAAALLKAMNVKREILLAEIIKNPKITDDIDKDVRFKLGALSVLDWVIGLPAYARKHIDKIDEEN